MAESKRIGTFLCWIFGHKFLIVSDIPSPYGLDYSRKNFTPTSFCVRCGMKADIYGENGNG